MARFPPSASVYRVSRNHQVAPGRQHSRAALRFGVLAGLIGGAIVFVTLME